MLELFIFNTQMRILKVLFLVTQGQCTTVNPEGVGVKQQRLKQKRWEGSAYIAAPLLGRWLLEDIET